VKFEPIPQPIELFKAPSIYYLSADLGQVNDFTAITIIQRIVKTDCGGKEQAREYHLRHIERLPLGTTYPSVIARIKLLADRLTDERRAVVIDLTGVGRPVWDLMQTSGFRGQVNGITITGGNTVSREGGIYSVPKRDLVTSLQVAFQNGQLKIARGLPEGDALVKELTNFKVKISNAGHDTYEAWRESIHDDIVLSASMGLWLATQKRCWMYGRNPGFITV